MCFLKVYKELVNWQYGMLETVYVVFRVWTRILLYVIHGLKSSGPLDYIFQYIRILTHVITLYKGEK